MDEQQPEVIPTQPKHNHKLAKILIGIASLILLAAIAYGAYTYITVKDLKKQIGITTDSIPTPDPEPTVTILDNRIKNRESTEKLSVKEYESEVEYYVAIMNKLDPRESLTELRKNIETDKALLRSCHSITHTVGQEAFVKYADFKKAMEYLDEVCNTGYMHGVIEMRFSQSENIEEDLKNVCDGHDEDRCMHGVGHGVMFYTQNDLPKSLKMCESFPQLSSQLYCSEGVFMENFNLDQKTHPSQYLSETDLFYPCSTQKEKYKYPCYYYAPLHYFGVVEKTYEQGIDWCNEAEERFVIHCVRGVSAVAIKQNISNPKLVEAACMTAEPNQIPYCIDGFVGLYINHYNSIDKAYQLCDTLLPSNQSTCKSSVESRKDGFQGEVKGAII